MNSCPMCRQVDGAHKMDCENERYVHYLSRLVHQLRWEIGELNKELAIERGLDDLKEEVEDEY